VRLSLSGATSIVKHIWLASAKLKEAVAPLSVTNELENNIGISRGHVIASASYPVKISDQLEADNDCHTPVAQRLTKKAPPWKSALLFKYILTARKSRVFT
jgi:hypothetical protein